MKNEIIRLHSEISRRDFLLSLSNNVLSVKTMEELVNILPHQLSGNFLLGDLVIEIINYGNYRANTYICSVKNTTLFADYIKFNPANNKLIEPLLSQKVIKTGHHLIFDLDEAVTDKEIQCHLNYWRGQGKTRLAGFPVNIENRTEAIIWTYLTPDILLTDSAIKLFEFLGFQIGKALQNIRLNDQIQNQLAELVKYKQHFEAENSYLTGEIKSDLWHQELNIYGKAMQQVSQLIKQVALSNSTVLILGETGTGKELVARAVHAGSARKNEIMIKINCAALPSGLIESELFGHEKGSFTGAVGRQIGKFELAENGTLFLDEIGEMPLEVQVKVLRAIQEREIERIGGAGPIKVNVRIVAATNRDLQREVLEGRFRSDLYYRLNVFPITLPRLRDRKEDIEKLTNQFIQKFSRTKGKKIYTVSKKSLNQMMDYDWPGNVRELEHLIERSILLTKGTVIKQLNLQVVNSKLNKSTKNEHFKTIEENEREHILLALEKTQGKIFGKGGAAEILGINFSTLNSRIKKLGIQKAVIVRSSGNIDES